MKLLRHVLAALAAFLLVALDSGANPPSPLPDEQFPDTLRMNQIQVIGTHNSYHQRPPEERLRMVIAINPDAKGWDYSHAPLDVQLGRGVRSFEIDLHDLDDVWQVFHVPGFDEETSCRIFTDCLATVKAWSEAHPRHVPIVILLEIKEDMARADHRIKQPDAAAMDRLDADIRSVLSEEMLLSPDDVRGERETLEEAVLDEGWPTLAEARGTIMFELHSRGEPRDLYLTDRPNLEGRAIFTRTEPGDPDAAFIVRDNPYSKDTPELVKKGYVVRTRADSGLGRGSKDMPGKRDAGIASGAQYVHTDFPPGEAHAETGYVMLFPGEALMRVNPISGPSPADGTE